VFDRIRAGGSRIQQRIRPQKSVW